MRTDEVLIDPVHTADASVRVSVKPAPTVCIPSRCPELPDTAAGVLLAFVTPGRGLGAMAAACGSWAQAARHPELWWRLCTRGGAPLVRPGSLQQLVHKEKCLFDGAAWRALAHSSRGILVAGWAAELPPWCLLRLLEALHSEGEGWAALTTLRGLVSRSDRVLAAGAGARINGEATKASTNRIASAFLPCPHLFPLSGGFALSFEEEDVKCGAETGGAGSGFGRFWVRFSGPPCGPVVLRALLALPGAEAGAPFVEMRLELRGDGGQGLRLDGSCDGVALSALAGAARRGALNMALRAYRPTFDTEGHPGGGGWIPWVPAKPSLRLL